MAAANITKSFIVTLLSPIAAPDLGGIEGFASQSPASEGAPRNPAPLDKRAAAFGDR